MNQTWRKLGLLYCPAGDNRHPKLLTHAANPLPVLIGGDVYRIFFSGRDAQNRSSVGAVDIDIVRRTLIYEHEQPIFTHGPAGSFYADGVSIGNCYTANGVRYMLFMGWQTPQHSHWRGDIGQLTVHPDGSLSLANPAPLFTANHLDPLSFSYPWVHQHPDGSYRMWYGSTQTWDAGNGEMLHVINTAASPDGQHWQREGLAIPYALGIAQAFSRPTAIQAADGSYRMWFSYRSGTGTSYRIGHATSPDGHHWQLALDTAGIDVSDSGWDADMIEYPFVFTHQSQTYMLYNGNGYGKSGFGLAVLES
ncbi:hypothetical protein KFZ76_03030 [Methylovulum psychrotolerans]|uniref:hypothetical protein n=1 Tax=Methylovulum psychrotolerans TaxID=1704499 RepID=UPI001BFF72FC|nr:hypothetical protein [Methylovulum psychrotolerans]MBT9096685.1 hypothetical protein [Methylovulum psychrotolerans]